MGVGGEGKHVMYSLVCVSQHHALAQNQWARLSKQSNSENKTKEPKQTTNEYSRMSTSTHTHTGIRIPIRTCAHLA